HTLVQIALAKHLRCYLSRETLFRILGITLLLLARFQIRWQKLPGRGWQSIDQISDLQICVKSRGGLERERHRDAQSLGEKYAQWLCEASSFGRALTLDPARRILAPTS